MSEEQNYEFIADAIVDTEEINNALALSEQIVAERDQKTRELRSELIKGTQVGVPKSSGYLRKPHVKFNISIQKKFLKEYARTGSITAAAARVGVDRKTVYNERDRNPAFEKALESTKMSLVGTLESYAIERVLKGETTTITDGEGNVKQVINKPCSPQIVTKVLEAKTDTYAKVKDETTPVGTMDSVRKLAAAFGLTLSEDKLKVSIAKEVDGEVYDVE